MAEVRCKLSTTVRGRPGLAVAVSVDLIAVGVSPGPVTGRLGLGRANLGCRSCPITSPGFSALSPPPALSRRDCPALAGCCPARLDPRPEAGPDRLGHPAGRAPCPAAPHPARPWTLAPTGTTAFQARALDPLADA